MNVVAVARCAGHVRILLSVLLELNFPAQCHSVCCGTLMFARRYHVLGSVGPFAGLVYIVHSKYLGRLRVAGEAIPWPMCKQLKWAIFCL